MKQQQLALISKITGLTVIKKGGDLWISYQDALLSSAFDVSLAEFMDLV